MELNNLVYGYVGILTNYAEVCKTSLLQEPRVSLEKCKLGM